MDIAAIIYIVSSYFIMFLVIVAVQVYEPSIRNDKEGFTLCALVLLTSPLSLAIILFVMAVCTPVRLSQVLANYITNNMGNLKKIVLALLSENKENLKD